MDATARGLHYRHFGEKLLAPLSVLMPALLHPGDDGLLNLGYVKSELRQEWEELRLANPSVFRFRWRSNHEHPGRVFHFLFYDCFGVFIRHAPNNATAEGG